MSPLPRRLRSFSLRTLMVLVGVAALGVWVWTEYDRYSDRCLYLAVEAIWRDNPNASK